jgi:hypothetical protein
MKGRSIRLNQDVSDASVNTVQDALNELRDHPQHFSSISKALVRSDTTTEDLCAVLLRALTGDDVSDSLFSALLLLALKRYREHEVSAEAIECADHIVAHCLAVGNPEVKQRICLFLREGFLPPHAVKELIELCGQTKTPEVLRVNAACTVAEADVELVPAMKVLERYLHSPKPDLRGPAALGFIRLGIPNDHAADAIESAGRELGTEFQIELLRTIRDSHKEVAPLRPFIERLLKQRDADPRLHYLAAQLLPAVDANADRVATTLLSLLTGCRCSNELLSGSIMAFAAIDRPSGLESVCLAHLTDASVVLRRTASRGLFAGAPLSVGAMEAVAKRLPDEEDTECLERLTSALIRCGAVSIPYVLPLIDAEPEKGRLDLYVQCLAKIGRGGIEALSKYLDVKRSQRLLHVIMGCIQRCGYGALGIVEPLCRFIQSTRDEEHIINGIICILSVSKKPTEALSTLLSLISVRNDLSPAVEHWAMLGVTLMREDAIELLDKLIQSDKPEWLRQRGQRMRDELAGNVDPTLAYLARIRPEYLVEEFMTIATIMQEHPDWSLAAIEEDLNRRAVPHPQGQETWSSSTIRKHLKDLEAWLSQDRQQDVRLTSRQDRKAGELTEAGARLLDDASRYVKWLRRYRKPQ